MPTRRTEPTHEGDTARRDAASAPVESPSADRMQGSNGPLHQPDPDDTNPAGDQDIDTAGTDADPLTRPEAATARPRRSSP
jgi:hypothetical protein